MKTKRKQDIYVITAVNIGNRPCGAIATVALHKTAEFAEQKQKPLGLITPSTVKGKFLMRKLWQLEFDWNDILDIKTREVGYLLLRNV